MAQQSKTEEQNKVIKKQMRIGFREYERSHLGVFLSAFVAGLELGFSILLMGALYTLFKGEVSKDMLQLITVMGYPIGFIFVIIGRSELFTEQTSLAMLPVLNGRATFKELLGLWGTVIFGNLLGGLLFAFFITWIGPKMGSILPEAFMSMAIKSVNLNWLLLLGSAVLAGWMMGLLGWLLTSVKESMSKIFMVLLITVIIGIGGLHHSIVGSIKILCGLIVGDAISLGAYFKFLIFALLGNAVGGAFFVATLKYSQLKVQAERGAQGGSNK